MQTILTLPRDTWRLARPYFTSRDRWIGLGLLATLIALNFALVRVSVNLNYWYGAFYNALQEKDAGAFMELLGLWHRTETGLLPGFTVIALVAIAISVTNRYLNQYLQIRWRQSMTETMLASWLGERAYYRISLARGDQVTDNPDQRIAEDIRDFIEQSLSLGIDFLANISSLISFSLILWSLSGPLTVLGITIPGYLVWASLLYAAFGTVSTHLIGRPLVWLRYRQQKVEADFRFALARLRENMEGVALSGGEAQETKGLLTRFAALRANWWDLMQRGKLVNIFVNGYNQVSSVFPLLVAAPRYFAGSITFGALNQTVDAFGQVQGAMSWFVSAYAAPAGHPSLTNLRAIIDRLLTFQAAIDAARAAGRDGLTIAPSDHGHYSLENATLRLPDGRILLDHAGLTLAPGVSTAITGRTGSGKSTLFRALAGIWPFGSGTVRPGPGQALFLPQRPYFPLGTLREAICYPAEATRFADTELTAALADVGLAPLAARLDDRDAWGQILSGGEQQRLSLARALLIAPAWLFLDEATASLDPESERAVLAMLRERLPHTTVISITHRPEVASQSADRVVFDTSSPGPAVLRK